MELSLPCQVCKSLVVDEIHSQDDAQKFSLSQTYVNQILFKLNTTVLLQFHLVEHQDSLVGERVCLDAEVSCLVTFDKVKFYLPVFLVLVLVIGFESHHLHAVCVFLYAALILQVKQKENVKILFSNSWSCVCELNPNEHSSFLCQQRCIPALFPKLGGGH